MLIHIRPIPLNIFFFAADIHLARYYFTSTNALKVKAKKDFILIKKSNKKWYTDSMQYTVVYFSS